MDEIGKEAKKIAMHRCNNDMRVLSSSEKPREACFDPGNIMNGTRIGTDFKLGSTVTYQCDSGYKIVDPSSIECVTGADGKPSWDRALPACQGTFDSVSLPTSTYCAVSLSRTIIPSHSGTRSLRLLLPSL